MLMYIITMGAEESSDITRRRAIQIIGGSAVAGTVGTDGVSAAGHVDTTVAIDNVGASAWSINSVDGMGLTTDTNSENPDLTFTETGHRYRFENGGYPSHPLAFRDDEGVALLSQSTTGSFETDSDVNWVDDGDAVVFTLTDDLASEMADYRCTVHSAMVGTATVDAPTVDYTPDTGSVSFTTPDDGAAVTTPVSFEMTASNFTVEPASSGVRDGAGHLHILVDQPAIEPGVAIPNNEANGYYHYGDGSTSAEIDLQPGAHTIRVQAGDAMHRAYDLTDTIQLTAEASDAPTDPEARALQIAGVNDSSELTQNDVTATITRFERGEAVDGVAVTQDDVTTVVTLFERD